MDNFDEKTREHLKHYVYLLNDPDSDKPFYVGKGKDNRVFDHPWNAKRIIVRHGLTKKNAYEVEAALIDTLKELKYDLENKQKGHRSIEKGWMTVDEIKRRYNAPPLDEIGADCVIVKINKTYKRHSDGDAIYKATRGSWVMAKNRLDGIKYVLAAYHNWIVGVFEVKKWSSAGKCGGKRERHQFDGKWIDDEPIGKKYINKSIAHKRKKGYANPVLYSDTFNKW